MTYHIETETPEGVDVGIDGDKVTLYASSHYGDNPALMTIDQAKEVAANITARVRRLQLEAWRTDERNQDDDGT